MKYMYFGLFLVQVLVLHETLEGHESTWCCPGLPLPSSSLLLPEGVQHLTAEQEALIQSCIPFEVVPSDTSEGNAQLKYQLLLPNVSHR